MAKPVKYYELSAAVMTDVIFEMLRIAREETDNGGVSRSYIWAMFGDPLKSSRCLWVLDRLVEYGLVGYEPAKHLGGKRGTQASRFYLIETDKDKFLREAYERRKAYVVKQAAQKSETLADLAGIQ